MSTVGTQFVSDPVIAMHFKVYCYYKSLWNVCFVPIWHVY